MEEFIKKYPVPIPSVPQSFSYPDSSLDLHGYSQCESEEKLEWFFRNALKRKYHTVSIITGVGTGVLRSLVQKKLKTRLSTGGIKKWEEIDNGVFWVILDRNG